MSGRGAPRASMSDRAATLAAALAGPALLAAVAVVLCLGVGRQLAELDAGAVDGAADLIEPAMLVRTLATAAAIALLAVVLAIPPAWAMRRLPAGLSAALVCPMLLPSYLGYAALSSLRAPGTAIGDRLAQLRDPLAWDLVNAVHAGLAMALWLWPVAAVVLGLAARALPGDAVDALRQASGSRLKRSWAIVRWLSPTGVAAWAVCAVVLLGSAVPLHLANQPTYALVIWRELMQSGPAGVARAWLAATPLIVIAVIAAGVLTRRLLRARVRDEAAIVRRDPGVHVGWLVTAAALWAVSALGPPAALAVALRDVGAIAAFWPEAGDRAATSAALAICVAPAVGVVCIAAAVLLSGVAGRRMKPWAAAVVGAALTLAVIPGVLIGGGVLAASSAPGLRWLGDGPTGLGLAQFARFAAIGALAGWWIAAREPTVLREGREQLRDDGVRGWLLSAGRLHAVTIVAAAAAAGVLSLHEIEAAVLLAPAGYATLSQYMLSLLHYLRDDQLAAAGVWLGVIGVPTAVAIALLASAPTRRWRRAVRVAGRRLGRMHNAGAAAALLLCSTITATSLGGCGGATGDGGVETAIAPVRVLGARGVNPGEIVFPRCIDTDGEQLWIIDKTARVQRFTPSGELTGWWRMPRFDRGRPVGVTCGPDGLIYIADTHEQRVAIYRPTEDGGEFVRGVGSFGAGPGEFLYPTDVAVETEADGVTPTRFYVSEYGGNDRVSVFDADWTFLFGFDGTGVHGPNDDREIAHFARENAFRRPQSIALDQDAGVVYVADAGNHRVVMCSTEGQVLREFTRGRSASDAPGGFTYPYGLEVLRDGTLLVAEHGGHRVQHIDPASGDVLGIYGTSGWGEGELVQPWGVTVLDGLVYVLDSAKDRVVAFELDRRREPVAVVNANAEADG